MKRFTIKDIFDGFIIGDTVEITFADGRTFKGIYYACEIDDEYPGDYINFSPFDANFDVVAIIDIADIRLIERSKLKFNYME